MSEVDECNNLFRILKIIFVFPSICTKTNVNVSAFRVFFPDDTIPKFYLDYLNMINDNYLWMWFIYLFMSLKNLMLSFFALDQQR